MFAPDADLSWLGGPRVIALEVHDFLAPKFGLTVRTGVQSCSGRNCSTVQTSIRLLDVSWWRVALSLNLLAVGPSCPLPSCFAVLSTSEQPLACLHGIQLPLTGNASHALRVQAVSGHVAAAFAPHRQYQIATDNEHLFYIDTKHLAAAHLPGTVRTARVKP